MRSSGRTAHHVQYNDASITTGVTSPRAARAKNSSTGAPGGPISALSTTSLANITALAGRGVGSSLGAPAPPNQRSNSPMGGFSIR